MLSKKFAVFSLLVSAYVGLQMSNIYVPEDFEAKTTYKIIYAGIRIAGVAVNRIFKVRIISLFYMIGFKRLA